ncbi:alanine racemase [Curtobacterium citreum]|uniref:Alanine racemase n=1 Tax=Curtobacterium citreum TaxID=2036 RepID=A0ABT2HGG0_9MICO|nr:MULTISPECIES: alanine racemase [Curtobacterium]MCS6522359.1 alanine racemase [Curtobacterium citreum]RDI01215.1 alanine racemase [Curtobacterium sp. AG1037]TQJ29488.1 alanine racemase [Curtobacterium citreum]GGL79831.1 alanine racemase [Curtobacterium citreum]
MNAFTGITVDREALIANYATVAERVAPSGVIAVVKANGYGHGAVDAARAFVDAGAEWLGVADLDEGIALRQAGIDEGVRILAWLHAPDEDFRRAARYDVTPAVSSVDQLAAAADAEVPVVHLCVDTGLSRNGAVESEWAELFATAGRIARGGGRTRVEGLMSHLSNASRADDLDQDAAFQRALDGLAANGVVPEVVHLAASAASIAVPETRRDAARVGLALYGLSPFADRSSADLGLRPAMRVTASVLRTVPVRAGEGVSYGYTWRAEHDTRLAVIGLGYADGFDRASGGHVTVRIGDRRFPVVGRVAMNAMHIDVGDADVQVGDEVVLWGDPADGDPAIEEWADAIGTINYEVAARVGRSVERRTT